MTDPTPTDTNDQTLPTDDESPADASTDEPPTGRPGDLAAAVVEYDDGPDECTIYPADASADALVTEWLTAEEGSFVDLDETR